MLSCSKYIGSIPNMYLYLTLLIRPSNRGNIFGCWPQPIRNRAQREHSLVFFEYYAYGVEKNTSYKLFHCEMMVMTSCINNIRIRNSSTEKKSIIDVKCSTKTLYYNMVSKWTITKEVGLGVAYTAKVILNILIFWNNVIKTLWFSQHMLFDKLILWKLFNHNTCCWPFSQIVSIHDQSNSHDIYLSIYIM